MNSYYFHPIVIDGSFAHATDSGIYTGAVSSGSQDSNSHCRFLVRNSGFKKSRQILTIISVVKIEKKINKVTFARLNIIMLKQK